jgi:hypothetical protein
MPVPLFVFPAMPPDVRKLGLGLYPGLGPSPGANRAETVGQSRTRTSAGEALQFLTVFPFPFSPFSRSPMMAV